MDTTSSSSDKDIYFDTLPYTEFSTAPPIPADMPRIPVDQDPYIVWQQDRLKANPVIADLVLKMSVLTGF